MEKKDFTSRGWMLTIPKHYENGYILEIPILTTRLSRWAWSGQLEKGDKTGYEHYQIYIENLSPIRFSTLKKAFPKAHIEKRRGTKKEAWNYVHKEDTRLEGDLHGEKPIDLTEEQGRRNDLERLRGAILEGESVESIIVNEPTAWRYTGYLDRLATATQAEKWSKRIRPVKGHYLYGEAGCGKTSGLYDHYGFESTYRITDYTHPFDAYNGEKILILDEFHSNFPVNLVLNILDIYPLQLPARYANKWAGYTEVWIVSNIPLDKQYPLLQIDKPEVWKAVQRRIPDIQELKKGGKIVFTDQ